jgi:putative oxidoreductase
MATIAMWKRTRITTQCAQPGDRQARDDRRSVVVRRPGEMGYPDNPYSREFSRRIEREASLGERASTAALLLGRAAVGGYFLYNGLNHFKNADVMSGYAAGKGVPAPKAAVLGSGALIALGGLSLLLGAKPKVGTALIAGFLAAVSPKMHDFWNQTDPQAKMTEQTNFLKNMALIGGAALAAAVPEPWPLSVGNR